jgi:hypothetical protein
MDYEDTDISYDNNVDNSEADIIPCPANVNDSELQDTDTWKSYDNSLGSNLFHCGYEGYLENATPTPEEPQQECFYDDRGDLVDEQHEDAGCRGTANQYDGHGWDLDALRHTFIDDGGIWEHGREGVATSVEHHWDNLCKDEATEATETNGESSDSSESQLSDKSIFDAW